MIKKLFFVVLFLAIGCKPGVKNEINKRDINSKDLAKYIQSYPNFKAQLEDLQKKYDAAWAEAEKITAEEEKAKKMSEANSLAMDDKVFSGIGSYDRRAVSVAKEKDELAAKASDKKLKKFASEIKSVVSETENALKEADTVVKAANPQTVDAAVEEIKKANGILISADGSMDRLKKKMKKG